ncbi:hypothetical protein REPUB_Repub11eG0128000 [Reevesia pubescens]
MAAAFSLKIVTNGALVLILCLLVLQGVSGCVSGHGCFHEKAAQNRKANLKASNEVVKGPLHGSKTSSASPRNRENFVGWELVTVPSGPDPLHHNGGSPKKPRTDP